MTYGGPRVTELRRVWAARLPQPCPRCGRPVNPGDLFDLDHVVPRSAGGRDYPDDGTLVPAHRSCNRAHGARLGSARRGRSGGFRLW